MGAQPPDQEMGRVLPPPSTGGCNPAGKMVRGNGPVHERSPEVVVPVTLRLLVLDGLL